MIKDAKDIIRVARERGLYLMVSKGPPRMPVPTDPWHPEATPALMEALRAWRLEIIEELQGSAAT